MAEWSLSGSTHVYRAGEGVVAEAWENEQGDVRWLVSGSVLVSGRSRDVEQAKAVAAELAETLGGILGQWKAIVRSRTYS